MHVATGVDMNQAADASDDQEHHSREAVEDEVKRGLKGSCLNPFHARNHLRLTTTRKKLQVGKEGADKSCNQCRRSQDMRDGR